MKISLDLLILILKRMSGPMPLCVRKPITNEKKEIIILTHEHNPNSGFYDMSKGIFKSVSNEWTHKLWEIRNDGENHPILKDLKDKYPMLFGKFEMPQLLSY